MSATTTPMLRRLAAEEATGALLCDTGTLYLHGGRVVHAESPAAPGVDVLLTACGRLTPDDWRRAVDRAGAARRVGPFLVETGQLTLGEAELIHLAAIYDAAYFVLDPADGPTRFRRGAAHWFGTVRPVDAGSLERETRRRRDLLDALWPVPQTDTAPVVRRTLPQAPPVTRRQRAVLDLADGVRTPAAIARLLGRPAFHTLVDVRRLTAAGHLDTPRGPYPTAPPPFPAWAGAVAGDPDTALLRRLRDALETRL
ncbi:hypothetical protein [Streptantibioticus cattleyicolor]|uniref:Uncharacterized protein n=1 Tax=Streptantibioticus cattleyicolor (strain ATCC 35852 / DSM 46488 / JCM 4925 / NBRC 14057 / NRRL 8057) TaxID=1003195 RepID=F8JJ34_STREN|nr:hypothetical protein [Streptantibioticus cattleyicolor]AEW98875.1 hypothetical protein SCATT_p06820 [Streptantibioticus cattleyicolor NRRL 8057 = DSM 46488]CCB72080.1 conserved protein of unknown function [Streptantibioticus cattleyicolor NRRL 8057 = DSM 46488]